MSDQNPLKAAMQKFFAQFSSNITQLTYELKMKVRRKTSFASFLHLILEPVRVNGKLQK